MFLMYNPICFRISSPATVASAPVLLLLLLTHSMYILPLLTFSTSFPFNYDASVFVPYGFLHSFSNDI